MEDDSIDMVDDLKMTISTWMIIQYHSARHVKGSHRVHRGKEFIENKHQSDKI